MPRRSRSILAPGYFHVLNRSAGQVTLFRRTRDYSAFLDVLAAGLEQHPVRFLSYCLMPTHWHLVVGPVDTSALALMLHWVTTTHAVRWRRRHRPTKVGPVYQGRFKAIPLTAIAELMRACRYVERNAAQAGLATRAQDWPWCSLSERLHTTGRLPLVCEPFLSSPAWVEYVNTGLFPGDGGRPGTLEAQTVENRPVPLRDLAKDPAAGGVKGRERVGGVGARRDEHQTDAHVEGAEHLGLGHAARALQPRKHRRHLPALAIK